MTVISRAHLHDHECGNPVSTLLCATSSTKPQCWGSLLFPVSDLKEVAITRMMSGLNLCAAGPTISSKISIIAESPESPAA